MLMREDPFPVDSPHSAQTLVCIWAGLVRRSIGLELYPAGRGIGLLIYYSIYWIGQ